MTNFKVTGHQLIRSFYYDDSETLPKKILRFGLAPLTAFYAGGRRLHQFYRLVRQQAVEVPVVSVGNISLGGTGKTAFVTWLVRNLEREGMDVGLLKRGEGTARGSIPTGERSSRDLAVRYGDEVSLLRRTFPQVPIGVGKNRVQLAQKLCGRNSLDLLVLDDGFQYRRLARDLDVVLIRESDFSVNWQFPSGPLREPLKSLRRTDYVSRYGIGGGLSDNKRNDCEYLPSPEYRLCHAYEFEGIYRQGQEVTEEYRDGNVRLVTTLARPQKLETMLRKNNLTVQDHVSLPDHSSPVSEVKKSINRGVPVLVTEKERVKLPSELKRRVGVVRSTFRVEHGSQLISEVMQLSR